MTATNTDGRIVVTGKHGRDAVNAKLAASAARIKTDFAQEATIPFRRVVRLLDKVGYFGGGQMKTLTDIKKRIVVGATILTMKNDYRPELDGRNRVVTRVQGNGYWWKWTGDPREGFSDYPKAKDVTFMDADTFRYKLGFMPARRRNGVDIPAGDCFVELRFLESNAAPVV